jgi:flavodoxin
MAFFTFSPPSLNFTFASAFVVFPAGHADRYVALYEENTGMKPLIIYQSKTGNTIKIVEAITTVLEADVLSVENAVPENLKDRNLIGFGSGIYWTRIDQKIYEFAALLPKGCNAFMFITSGMGFTIMLRLYWYYIKTNFDHLGVNLIGRWDCRGYDKHPLSKWMGISKGHPNTFDIESVKQFAMKMKEYT